MQAAIVLTTRQSLVTPGKVPPGAAAASICTRRSVARTSRNHKACAPARAAPQKPRLASLSIRQRRKSPADSSRCSMPLLAASTCLQHAMRTTSSCAAQHMHEGIVTTMGCVVQQCRVCAVLEPAARAELRSCPPACLQAAARMETSPPEVQPPGCQLARLWEKQVWSKRLHFGVGQIGTAVYGSL